MTFGIQVRREMGILNNGKVPRIPIPKAVREYVMKRDRRQCQKCGSNADLAVDHIVPLSKGGANDMSNFQVLCRRCNSKKGANIPANARQRMGK